MYCEMGTNGIITNGFTDHGRENKFYVRKAMTSFWSEHSKDASLEEMMLDSNAEELTKQELPEILSYLPTWQDKDVVELGAGIGRFTGELATKAKSVLAVDFMEKFVTKNRETNNHHENVTFHCEDVTKLDLAPDSYDLVFSNWLMMYLEDEEVQTLVKKELLWLREDGYLFARESCVKQSGNKKRGQNPTKYRDPQVYLAIFTTVNIPTESEDEEFGFELVLSRPVYSYIKMKDNKHQQIWLLQKTRRRRQNNHGFKTFQEFLDNQQYSSNGILRYEKIFGRTFVSTGGIDTTKDFVARLNLQKNEVVLDVGCGIGGSAFYMVKEYGVKVIAIDLSSNMIQIGIKRAEEEGISAEDVQFEVADATKREYQPEVFDVIYSRDTILHIPDKLALFKNFYKWLKVGGRLLISDYCCSEGEHSEVFKNYVRQRGYNLLSPRQYGEVLEQAGFVNVQADDRTDLFVQSLEKEVVKTESIKTEFIQTKKFFDCSKLKTFADDKLDMLHKMVFVFTTEFSQEDYDYIVNGWKDKMKRTQDQRWGVFYAEKK